jgi:hypothetical protein
MLDSVLVALWRRAIDRRKEPHNLEFLKNSSQAQSLLGVEPIGALHPSIQEDCFLIPYQSPPNRHRPLEDPATEYKYFVSSVLMSYSSVVLCVAGE